MQRNTNNTDKSRLMHFTQQELIGMSEAELLNFVVAYHQFRNRDFKAINDIAHQLDLEPQTISNYVSGKGQPGYDHLIKLYRHTKCELVLEWIEARKSLLTI